MKKVISWWKSLDEDHKWVVGIAIGWTVCFLPHSLILACLGPVAAKMVW